MWTNGEDGLTQDHRAVNKLEGRLNGKEANSSGGGSLRMFYSGGFSALVKYPTYCDPMDYILLGSSVNEILQARILEWVAMPSSRVTSQLRD